MFPQFMEELTATAPQFMAKRHLIRTMLIKFVALAALILEPICNILQ